MELTYRLECDYYLPNLSLPESPRVGKYSMLRRTYLRNHHRGIYTGMMLSRTLNAHLEKVDQQANDMLQRIVKQMAKEQGITEQMKAGVGTLHECNPCSRRGNCAKDGDLHLNNLSYE